MCSNTFCNSGFPLAINIEDYAKNREKHVSKGRGSNFTQAVREVDDFVADPEVIIHFSIRNSLLRYETIFLNSTAISGKCSS